MSAKAMGGRRVSRQEIDSIVSRLIDAGLPDVMEKFQVCGSYRRGRPDSGDIDIVAIPKDLDAFKEWHKNLPWETKVGFVAYYVMIDGVQIDFFLATHKNWGVKVLNYTGPASFNIFVSHWCRTIGLTFTRGGIFDKDRNEVSDQLSEEEIFNLMKMDFIEPQNRQTLF